MPSRKTLLAKLLEALVEEWGGEEVRSTLDRTLASKGQLALVDERSSIAPRRSRSRPSAISLVEQESIGDEKKKLLFLLADQFDKKEFLPSVADVRQFIIMSGERPRSVKDRFDGFKSLLKLLVKLPPDKLETIADAASNSGPAQLGPISDAISAAGQVLPRQRESASAKTEADVGPAARSATP